MTCNTDASFDKIKIGNYQITNYCEKCNNEKCKNFSFIKIMYSRVPTILALTQLSLAKISFNLTEEEYNRLINYNVKYIGFLEELYTKYRKSLISIQLANFNFSTDTCVLADEIYHIFIKWFEKLVFWNRVNSIKATPCTYYKLLLSENVDFIFSLLIDSIKQHNNKDIVDILKLYELKEKFKSDVINFNLPKSNGEYFQHTERIKDLLFIYLECIFFWLLSLDRSLKSSELFLYVTPSMFLINTNFSIRVLRNIIEYVCNNRKVKNNKTVTIKVVTSKSCIKNELMYRVKSILEPLGFDVFIV